MAMKQASSRTIRVTLHQDTDGTYWADSPDAVGCFTVGTSIDATLANMKDALRTHLDLSAKAHVELVPTFTPAFRL